MITKTIASHWPAREAHKAVRVTHIEYSDVFRFDYTEDGVLSISIDERLVAELDEIPPFVQALLEQKASVSLNAHNQTVLRRLLSEVKGK